MKIKEEQLKTIQEQQQQLNNIIHEIGLLETNKHSLLHQIVEVNKDVEETKAELEKEYGAVNINLEDGTYTEIEKTKELTSV